MFNTFLSEKDKKKKKVNLSHCVLYTFICKHTLHIHICNI